MKVTVSESELKLDNKLCVAFDVGKSTLDSYAPFSSGHLQLMMTDRFDNRSNAVRGALLGYQKLAADNGLEGVHVVCEPTGGCERTLLRIAHELNMTTAYVNGESVAKLRVVRQNDTGKTDQLDPRIIHLASSEGRQLKVRRLGAGYSELREMNVVYDQICDQATMLKNCIHDALYRIFPDLRMNARQLFSSCGAALVRAFGGDPVAISRLGLARFSQRMKTHAPRLRTATLERIHEDAHVNAMHLAGAEVRTIQRDHLRDLYERWRALQDRKEVLKQRMRDIYQSLPESDKLMFPGVPAFIMARLIGETGPLSDYASGRRLLRMAGLNLRERKSGKHKGKNRISKKGRARLRKILYQAVLLFMIKPGSLYSMDYARKKVDGVCSVPIIVELMRKFTSAMFGLHRSQSAFNLDRFTTCESQLKAA